MKFLSLLLACVSLALLAGTVEAAITITTDNIEADAVAFLGYDNQFFIGTTIPTHTTLNAAAGDVYSKNAIDWDVSGGQTVLSLGVDHKRTGDLASYAATANPLNALTFVANSNEPYELSGFYNVTDVGASGYDQIYADLLDVVSGDLFVNEQDSQSTPNQHFILGGTGGDLINNLYGSPTGNLIAGHTYQLFFGLFTGAPFAADSGASALGNITLKIGTATATPEPLSVIVWGGLILGVVVVARRVKFLQS